MKPINLMLQLTRLNNKESMKRFKIHIKLTVASHIKLKGQKPKHNKLTNRRLTVNFKNRQ